MTPIFAYGVSMIESLVITLIMLFYSGGSLAPPLGIPPAPEDPVMHQAAPAECLAYVTWAGMATPNAKSPNQTEQLLAEPDVQQFVKEILQTIDKIAAKQAAGSGPEAAAFARELSTWVKTILSHPAALYLSKVVPNPDSPDIRAGAIFHLGQQSAAVRGQIEKLLQRAPPTKIQKTQVAGLDGYRAATTAKEPAVAWAFKGPYLLVGVGAGELEALVGRLGQTPPKWLGDIAKQLPVARRSSLSYVNLQALRDVLLTAISPNEPAASTVVGALGLDRLQSLISVSGLDAEGIAIATRVQFSGQPDGIFRMLDPQPLALEDLSDLPANAVVAAAGRINLPRILQGVDEIIGRINANSGEKFRRALEQVETLLGLDLHDDLLALPGNVVRVYLPSAGMATGLNVTACLAVRDRPRLAAAHDKLLAWAERETLRWNEAERPKLERSSFSGHTLYTVVLPEAGVPIRPSWCLTEKELVIGLLPSSVKEHVLRRRDKDTLAEAPAIKEVFVHGAAPFKLVYENTPEIVRLAYPLVQLGLVTASGQMAKQGMPFDVTALPASDTLERHLRPSISTVVRTPTAIELRTRGALPALSSGVPMFAGVAAGLVLPAISKMRGAARNSASMSNLRHLALAALTYENSKGALPAAYTVDRQNRPLLSWRVQLLPYVEEETLYRQFHHDEPWDSPHNKQLIARMPPIFRSLDAPLASGKTRYLSIRGERTAMPGAQGVKLAKVLDGLTQTILFVEAAPEKAVIWTKPDDLVPDRTDPTKGLFAPGHDQTPAVFLDGHAQRLRRGIDAQTLKALFTRDGGEPVRLVD